MAAGQCVRAQQGGQVLGVIALSTASNFILLESSAKEWIFAHQPGVGERPSKNSEHT